MSAQPQPRLCLIPPRAGEWLTAEEVIAVTGWSRRTFFNKVGELVARDSGRIGNNGRPIREYLAASLPGEAVNKLAGECRTPEWVSGLVPLHQTPLFAGLTVTKPQRIVLPDPMDQQQAEERLTVLQPILEYTASDLRWSQLRLSDGSSVTSQTRMIRYQAETSGNCERTIKNWLSRYRSGGFPALADRQRKDKNTSRWFAEHHDAAILAAWWYLECRQSVRACYEAIVNEREKLGLSEEDLPSYETVRAWLKAMPPYLTAYAREGRAAYQARMAPYITRSYGDIAPNQIWVSDHMIHDVEVANDCFPELPWGAPMRLRFTCLLDFRSRYVVGASWTPHESSASIATAMRRAIERWGVCEHFYCDNGKDYRKVAKGAIPAWLSDPAAIRGWWDTELRDIERTGILARLGVKVTHCIVRHPQSKHVERFFRTLHERFDKRFYQHYTGGAPHLRPDATAAAMEIHRKLLKHDRVELTTHPPASFLIAGCMAWIEEYHRQPHSGDGMDGRTPAEVFAERRQDAQRCDSASLALLLAERSRRRVRECAIDLNRRRYTYTDAVSRDLLHEWNERDVLVASDPADPSAVAILDEDGHFLCWAAAEEKLGFDPANKEIQRRIGESMSDRRHMEKATRELVGELGRNARRLGAATPLESLAQNAHLPAIVAPALTHRAPKPTRNPEASAPPTPAQAARLLLEGLRK